MGIRITRRELALAAAGAASAARGQSPNPAAPNHQTNNQASQKFAYAGALDGLENQVDLETFDPVRWTLQRHDSAPLRLSFRATTRPQAEAWQKELRSKLLDLLGGFPSQRTPPRAKTLEVRSFSTHKREKFVFESRPGVGVLGYLLTPLKTTEPLATVVCIPGHGRGVDDLVGIDDQGRERATKVGYEYDFAIQAVERGLAAVAIEPMAFGCRRDAITKAKGATAYACQPVAGSALLLGETLLGWRIYDVMRTLDWIETRPELNAKRIGCMGISGGGTCALFAAAVEPRIRAALVSGYLNTFRASIMSMSHCMDNYVPGILQWAEMYDIAGLIAPRPLFSEGGDRDPIFPVNATRESFARVKQVYEVFGAPDAVQQEIFPGVHEFHGVRGLPFLADALKA